MTENIKHREVEENILKVRGQNVILDRDVALLYGVDTKEINQSVKNNPAKFPEEYIIHLTAEEWNRLRSKFLTLNDSGVDADENDGGNP